MATKITTMGNLIDYTNTITDSDKKTKAQKYLRSRFHSFVKEHPVWTRIGTLICGK